jgi:hypothetical protein
MVIRPRWVPRLFGVDRGTATRTAWLPRMLGGREIALGLGALAAVRDERVSPGWGSARAWLLAGALTDATDLVAMRAGIRDGSLPRIVGGLAALASASAVAAGIAASVARPRSH